MSFDPRRIHEETAWLLAHPDFEERPASIAEFLGGDYLDIEGLVRPGLLRALQDIFGEDVNGERIAHYEEAMITGGIGIGKTTFASIALPYMCHWVLCLRDPQRYFRLLPGSRIAFMQMSTSERQAIDVIFGDIFARIKHSPWFVNNYPHDPKFTKVVKFPKDVHILPGDSAETTFEGYNILAGILDEMDSHKVTKDKDYAEEGFNTIQSRIASRFVQYDEDGGEAGHRGLLICIGQMKKGTGFAAKKYAQMRRNPKAYTMRMSIWESLGWDKFTRKNGTRNSFWYDTKRKIIIPTLAAGVVKNDNMIEVPNAYRDQFDNSPEKALKDLAGIPPATNDPFISLVDRVEECRERWIARYSPTYNADTDSLEDLSPVSSQVTRTVFKPWFMAVNDPRKRHIHVDLAYSGEGDALGMAMGYVDHIVEEDGEKKPYIIFDFLARVRAAPGTEIMLSDIRRVIYELRDDRGFRVYSVSYDGFESTDSVQQLRKRKFNTDKLSMDKSTLPYEDLRECIYDRRCEFPPYVTYLRKGDGSLVEIAVKELMELQDTGKKIDHPETGSKDVADAMAGVVSTLMGDRTYRRGVGSGTSQAPGQVPEAGTTDTGIVLPFPGQDIGLQAPIPPQTAGGFGLTIPTRLQPGSRNR